MAVASELVRLGPALQLWNTYDPAVKAELFSTAISTQSGQYLIDPIPLHKDALAELVAECPVAGVIVSNANHLRAAPQFANMFHVPILARSESFSPEAVIGFKRVVNDDQICDELRVIAIDGAVSGEIVLHYLPNGGALIVGDALINFEPYGFALLPDKYCSDQKEMRASLRKLLACNIERMFFAHGTPITSQADERLRQLLDADL